MMSEETVGRFRQLIPYEGETAEELEEILKDDTAIPAVERLQWKRLLLTGHATG